MTIDDILTFEENLERIVRKNGGSKTEVAQVFGKPSLGVMVRNRLMRKKHDVFSIKMIQSAAKRLQVSSTDLLDSYLRDRRSVHLKIETDAQLRLTKELCQNWDDLTGDTANELIKILGERN